jgi:hypothetical protein
LKGRKGMELEILGGYEGANPQSSERIERLGEDGIRVSPESEDGDSNYKFAFEITVKNRADSVRSLNLDVDWQEPPQVGTKYMANRAALFCQHNGSAWQEIRGQLDGDHVHFRLVIPPGTSRVGLHPSFGRHELEAFFAQAGTLGGAKRITFGQSAEGRPLEAAVLPGLDHAETCMLGIGRFHPYESAGSYCIWGILDLLAGARGETLRAKRTFVLVPVANPDGVAHGLCKRTAWGGVNLSAEGNESNDPTACALRGLIAGVGGALQRTVLLDAHGWMNREDGLWVYRAGLEGAILAQLDPDLFPHGWRTYVRDAAAPDSATGDLRQFAALHVGMETAVISIPWFGRSQAQMRRIGAAVAEAVLRALS